MIDAAVTLSLPLCSGWRNMTRRDQCALLCDHIRAAEHFSQNSKRSAFLFCSRAHLANKNESATTICASGPRDAAECRCLDEHMFVCGATFAVHSIA